MSERERWIVYPLLFLALGAGLRDKLIDRTLSKSIVCQELTVLGDDRGGRRPVPLVQIGAVQSTSTNVPPFGQVLINGQLVVEDIRAETVNANAVNANNYIYRRIPFAPSLLRAIPGVSPTDWLRALQQRANAVEGEAAAGEQEDEPPAPSNEQPPTQDNSN
jgi:hypothetical protein